MERIILLSLLVCPIVMGALMIWMMRSMRREARDSDSGGAGHE